MKTLIVYVSEHHGNTAQIATALGEVLSASLEDPSSVTQELIDKYELVGFGSGIFRGKHHQRVMAIDGSIQGNGTKAFLFSTSGIGKVGKYHQPLKRLLEERGFKIIGDFACPGHDSFGPLKLIGGIHKHRPNDDDLNAAREFARGLLSRYSE